MNQPLSKDEKSQPTSNHDQVSSPPQAQPHHLLEIRNLVKRYGKKIAVDGIDFQMKSGEIVGFLGPNGAGKTTTFYSVVGFVRPTKGTIFLDTHDITHLPMYKRARRGISYLPQESSVFRKLTVKDNILAILETRRDLSRKERNQVLDFLMEELGITHLKNQPAYTLSGGERRRTEIARALALEPLFLLLDEPFAGIDPIAVYEIKTIVKKLAQKGIGILITDHNVRDTLEITDRSYIIHQGKIVVAGNPQEIMENSLAREVYLGTEFRM